MNSPAVRAWWKFVRIAIAVYLASLFAGAVRIPLGEDGAPAGEMLRQWMKLRSVDSRVADLSLRDRLNDLSDWRMTPRTTLRITLTADAMAADCRVVLPRPFFEVMQRTVAQVVSREVLAGIVGDYCGRPMIEWETGGLAWYRFYVGESGTEGILEARFHPLVYEEVSAGHGAPLNVAIRRPLARFERHEYTIEIVTQGAGAMVRNVRPVLQTESRTVIRGTVRTLGDPEFRIVVPYQPTSNAPEQTRRRQIAEVVQAFSDAYTPIAEPLVDALVAALPFLLVFAIRRETELTAVRGSHRLFRFANVAILFYAGVGLFRASTDLVRRTGEGLANALTANKLCGTVVTQSGAPALLVAFVFVLWPLLVWSRARLRLPATSPRRPWLFLGASLAAAAAALFARPCIGIVQIPLLAAATVFALAALVSEFVDRLPHQLLFALLTFEGASLFLIVDRLTFDVPRWYLVVAPFTVPMIYTVLRLAMPNASRAGLLLGAAIAALLLAYGPPDVPLWKPWHISAIGFDLSRAAMLAAVAGLVWLLYHVSRTGKWHELERGERAAGAVLVLLVFFVGWSQILYALTAFVAAWAVMRYWIFVPRRIPADADPDSQRSIRDLIRLNEMEAALHALKREMRAKLSKAEVKFDAYATRIDEMETHVEEQWKKLCPTPDLPAAAVLSSGTPIPPWARGVDSARYGLLFGIPWIVLFLREFHTYVAPQYGSDWVATLAAVIHAVVRWPLLGFVFGYFYPHLRGDSGISKGFYLFVGVAMPLFAATAIGAPASTAAWKSLAYFALQLFIHCLLLGLIAGDYETLKASGLRWRHVIDVHNLGGVAAWGSSMIVAIATAATTLTPAAAGSLASMLASEFSASDSIRMKTRGSGNNRM